MREVACSRSLEAPPGSVAEIVASEFLGCQKSEMRYREGDPA